MNLFTLLKSQKNSAPVLGFIEKKGGIYHGAGRFRQSASFTHALICQRSNRGTAALAELERNSAVLAEILYAERRDALRGAASVVFRAKPNFEICFSVQPNVGKERVLFHCGVYLRFQQYDDVWLARTVCRFMAFVASDMEHHNLPFLLLENAQTNHFWHNVILTAYLRSVREGDR